MEVNSFNILQGQSLRGVVKHLIAHLQHSDGSWPAGDSGCQEEPGEGLSFCWLLVHKATRDPRDVNMGFPYQPRAAASKVPFLKRTSRDTACPTLTLQDQPDQLP